MNDDVFFASIGELNAKLKAREFSARDLTRAFTERMEKLGPRYNALALLLPQQAIRAAKNIDDDLKRQRFRGLLQGIPYGVKDLLSLEKQPTTWGAAPYAGQVFDYTATVIKKLDKANAVLTSKLAMVELAGGPSYRYANASLQGAGLNPWDRTRWSGGSSSGSAIAVAAGLVTFALGSETSGSILTPSAFCGVTGLRPTYGLVSRHGAMALSWTMDKIGPLCRSAEDCGIVLEAIAGGDIEDPASAGKGFYNAPQYTRDLKTIRVGYAPVDFEEWAEPAARPDLKKAFEVIRGMGMQVAEAKLPDFPYGALAGTIVSAEAASIFEPLIESGKVEQLVDARQKAGLKAGLEIPAKDYLRAMRVRSLVQKAFRELLADVDVLVTPTRPAPAPKISEPLDRLGAGRPRPKDPGFSSLIPAGNLVGMPALSLPCGFADGMPIAISLVGRPFSENILLKIGRQFQAETDWHRRRPPMGEHA
ncbi:MAG TPA: amidase [Bryobacteraceae bacterium]|nr:amidase [Bryobacteraceae bacterium]